MALTSVQLPFGADEDDDFVPFGSRNGTFQSTLLSKLWWSESIGIVGIALLIWAMLIPIANYGRYLNFRKLIKDSAKVCAWDTELEKMVGERLAFVKNDIGEGISVYDTEQEQKEKAGTSVAVGSQKDNSKDKKKETKDKSDTTFQTWDLQTTKESDWKRKHVPGSCLNCISLRENRVAEGGGEPSWELKWSGIGKEIPVVLMNASGATVASAASPATEPPLDSNECPGIPALADADEDEAFAPILPVAVLTVRACDNDDEDPTDSVVLVRSNKNDEIIKDIQKVVDKGFIPSAFLLISKKTGGDLEQLKKVLRAVTSVPVFLVTFDPGIIIFKAALRHTGGRIRFQCADNCKFVGELTTETLENLKKMVR